jgi:Adenosine-deaminase (editase) domain
MEDKIAACALDHYDKVLPSNKGKPKENEWTVFAAIVAVEEERHTQRCWVVSCATGTKCSTFVPPKDMLASEAEKIESTILRDCHAETLARRGLVHVLWKEIDENSSLPNDNNNHRLLENLPNSSPPQFQLRSNVTLHYYISDPPCGDASIFPLNEIHVTLNAKKSKTNDTLNFTGAKVIVNSLNGVQAHDCSQLLSDGTVAREHVQLLGKLRTKSGRSNLPDHMRSTCMSCSDKLVRWSVLGLQGSLLTRYIPSGIRFTSIIVSRDRRALSLRAQEEALKRATQDRVVATLEYVGNDETLPKDPFGQSVRDWKGPSVHIVERGFARGKSRVESDAAEPPSKSEDDASQPAHNNPPQSKKRKRDHASSSPCGICIHWNQSLQKDNNTNGKKNPVVVEQIVGARGICQGKKPKSAEDYRRLSSQLSRASLVAQARRVLKEEGEKEASTTSYSKWKQKNGDESYQKIRSIIFEGGPLAGWLTSS